MENLKKAYEIKAKTIIKNLKLHKMEGFYCDNKEEALKKAVSLLNKGESISWGGSKTLAQIGLFEELNKEEYKLIDRAKGETREEVLDIMRDSFKANTYFMSTNAITMKGELVNIDGNGNRVAALCFGPESVVIICGMNKVSTDVESAIKRIKLDACPANCIRLGIENPCAITGQCNDCINNSICCQTVITRVSRTKNRIKVILVGEELGY